MERKDAFQGDVVDLWFTATTRRLLLTVVEIDASSSSWCAPGSSLIVLGEFLCNRQENIIHVHCSLCRCFHEEKAILVGVSLSFLLLDGTLVAKIRLVTGESNHNVRTCLSLQLFHPCLGATEGILWKCEWVSIELKSRLTLSPTLPLVRTTEEGAQTNKQTNLIRNVVDYDGSLSTAVVHWR